PATKGVDVYELFAGRKVDSGKPLAVDLRHAPARVFVALPKAKDVKSIADRIPVSASPPLSECFGARIRDLVVSRDNRTALIAVAGWDRNAMFIDPQTGKLLQQGKIGHHFAYSPLATSHGFAVQGYDLHSAEGYHLYLFGDSEKSRTPLAERRFALYGLPK